LKVYIAGPVSGIPNFNRDAFARVERLLLAAGHEVVNPLRASPYRPGKPWAAYMRDTLPAMLACDRVQLLPGWWHSRGTLLEIIVARACRVEIKKPISF
jgi:hypothetical protein